MLVAPIGKVEGSMGRDRDCMNDGGGGGKAEPMGGGPMLGEKGPLAI